ncbi:MAG: DeoR/GlpR transcriptional regulator [Clostridia bacterium]|nr:DeoR/GlpR transcriptional regulator [Clostridia bacterium]
MSISARQKQILDLLEENGFLSVERLAECTYTSPSSIRRDLSHLQNLSLIRRTHGGASVLREINQAVPLRNRMARNLTEKRLIAKKASAFLHDGMAVMLDGSSTAGFLVPYIAKHKDMIVFTNNMLTAISAINYGIPTHCIGGCSVNCSAVLSGARAYAAVEGICPDILFFSSQSLDAHGYIYDPIEEENHIRTLMLKNAKVRVFLCDSEKFGSTSLYRLTNVDEIDACVFDKPYPELRAKCEIVC